MAPIATLQEGQVRYTRQIIWYGSQHYNHRVKRFVHVYPNNPVPVVFQRVK